MQKLISNTYLKNTYPHRKKLQSRNTNKKSSKWWETL